MNRLQRRARYQYGSLILETRQRAPPIWVYRFYENVRNKRTRSKVIVDTEVQLRGPAHAERKCQHLWVVGELDGAAIPSQPTIGSLIDLGALRKLHPPVVGRRLGAASDGRSGQSPR